MTAEELLTRTLREVTENTDYPTTPLAGVQARAGAVRARSRRTAVLAAAAAVAVVAGSTALWVSRSPNSSPPPSQELSSGPTSSPTTVALSSLPRGRAPGIDYLVGSTYVTMSGDRITSPVLARADAATTARGGILAAVPIRSAGTDPAGSAGVYLVTGQKARQLGCGTDRFAMSTDGVESAYWLSGSCSPAPSSGRLYSGVNNTMGESGAAYITTPKGAVDEPVGLLPQGVVVNDRGWDRGQGVHPLLIALDGTTTRLGTLALAGGSDTNRGVVSGQLADATTTGAVVDASTGAVLWRVPGWRLGQFSTDGRYVVAQRADGSEHWAIFDARRGTPVATLEPLTGVAIRQVAWDFDDTLLAVASDGRSEAILRFDRQGHATRATPTQPVAEEYVYRLATRP